MGREESDYSGPPRDGTLTHQQRQQAARRGQVPILEVEVIVAKFVRIFELLHAHF